LEALGQQIVDIGERGETSRFDLNGKTCLP
jgi:hypothetical protein